MNHQFYGFSANNSGKQTSLQYSHRFLRILSRWIRIANLLFSIAKSLYIILLEGFTRYFVHDKAIPEHTRWFNLLYNRYWTRKRYVFQIKFLEDGKASISWLLPFLVNEMGSSNWNNKFEEQTETDLGVSIDRNRYRILRYLNSRLTRNEVNSLINERYVLWLCFEPGSLSTILRYRRSWVNLAWW